MVFPTCVGVFLSAPLTWAGGKGLPHVRGGVSSVCAVRTIEQQSSPRAWGCFSFVGHPQSWQRVFPTCVGVFLSFIPLTKSSSSLPHVRGGVSQ